MNSIFTYLISFLGSFLTIPIFKKIAFRFSILDLPSQRKMHQEAKALLGGAAVYFGFLCGIFSNQAYLPKILPLLASATLIFLVGLLDDIRGLGPQIRLVFQVVASAIIIFACDRINFLPVSAWGDVLEIVITFIWLVGITNAYNYLDGLDGLASMSLLIHSLFFCILLYGSKQYFLMIVLLSIGGATLGFIPYNIYRARIFLGDSGSTLLGFVLAATAVVGHWAQDNVVKITIPILILGVPIYDMTFTTIMRVKERKIKTVAEWLKFAGKDHFHHYLVSLDLSVLTVVFFISVINLLLGINALLIANGRMYNAILSLLQSALIFVIITTLLVKGRSKEILQTERRQEG